MRRLRALCALALATVCVAVCSDPVAPANTSLGLRVWAEVAPETLHLADSATALFEVRVMVMNPAGHPIVVPAPTALVPNLNPVRSVGFTEQYRISCSGNPFNCGPSNDWLTTGADTIPGLQVTSVYRVIALKDWASGWTLAPGTYRVHSWYREQEGDSATLVLVP